MENYNTVLFDYDGTIMDTNEVVYNSWQHTFKKLTGKEGPDDLIYKTYGEPLKTCMATVFGDEERDNAVEIYREYQQKYFDKDTFLFDGVKELLVDLKDQGYKVGVVTSRLRETTMIGLKDKGIDNLFDLVVTAEDTKKHKPNPDPILKAVELIGAEKEKCIYIGDTNFDLLSAKNADVKSVLVGWAVAYHSQENKVAPDYEIKKAEELLQIL